MEDKKPFECPRCGSTTKLKANLTIHLQSKTPCEAKLTNISREEALKSLKKERKLPLVHCDHCNKPMCKKTYKKHVTICPQKPTILHNRQNESDERDKRLINTLTEILHKELKEFKQQLTSPSTTYNNTYNNTISIQINTFGNESTTHLTNEFLSQCLLNPTKGITNLIENIHYSDDVPENRNVRFKSNKNNTFEKYTDEQWIECDTSNTLDELIRKGYRVMSKHYTENYLDNPDYDDDVRRAAIEKFRFLADINCNQYSSVKRDIRLLIKNKTCYVIAPPELNGDIVASL
jgi:hypothetical protein